MTFKGLITKFVVWYEVYFVDDSSVTLRKFGDKKLNLRCRFTSSFFSGNIIVYRKRFITKC